MQKVKIDFDNPGLPQHISAMKSDSLSRFFEVSLYQSGKSYEAPSGVAYSIMYQGFGAQNRGWYDTINDGAGKRDACTVAGNVITCEIARQALQVPGAVSFVLCITASDGYMLKSWPILCDCSNDSYDSTAEVESFFYITQVSNASWTQAIQAWENLKTTIDDTLTVSGKAADAKATGNKIEEEANRAKAAEKELDNRINDVSTGGSGSGAIGIAGAAADGETDDTEALTAALNQSNTVIDGGNKKYKYLSITMTNVENLTVKNIIFWKGQTLEVAGCKNIRFEHCTWEGVNNNGSETVWTCGIRLRERKDADGNEIWCENIWIEHCVFRDINYNPHLNNGHGVEISGQAILPRSVHKLYIKNNFFTQCRGNACIHWNTYKACGYAEITDNTFYLNGLGGVCVYAVQQKFPKVKGKISNNQFIGCGLGYMPDEFFEAYPAEQQGLGCAALLGGASTRACPYKWQFVCENNTFEDNVESSIEGPTWNPCIGNSITGQGAIQTEENCRLMEEKYHLDYKLHVRVINSVNFIYRNYYRDVDGTFPNEDDDPIVYQNNTMGVAHVSRASYIQFKGEYNCPVIFTGNTMRTGKTIGLDTHFLFCTFKNSFRFENNDGIYPYFNSCTFEGDVILDDILSAYRCDFSKANLITNNARARFPETRTALYDPSRMLLENDQATAEGGYPVLRSYDIPETVEKPTDTAYDIATADGYTEADGYVFGGPSAPNHIDTGIQLLKDGGDFTIFLQFDGNATTDIPSSKGTIMPLFTVYNAAGAGAANEASYRCTVGGQWANATTALKTKKTYTVLNKGNLFTLRSMQLLMRRKGAKLEFWTMLQGTDASDLTENYVSYDLDETNDQFADFEGSLYIGAPDGYFSDSNVYALWGKMKTFQLFERALSDGETAMLLYNKVFESGEAEEDVPVYDIATDSHYSAEDSAVTFDGTFGIDTGIKLFADSSDFTVLCKFRLDSYHDEGLKNFNFIPVLSAMNYAQTEGYKTKSPGFDIGLSLQSGSAMENVTTGGFVTFRNSWKFANSATILNSYFGYCDQDIGVICIRKNGVLNVYDFNMQRKATLSGADATTAFDGTLHIGANMVAPPLGDNNMLKGKVYECKVYDKALSTSVLENMFPNLYSNEKRTKGAVRCMVPSLRYNNQLLRYIFLETMIDMGKYSSAEYAGKYPKAVGIRVDGVDEIIWCPTGSNTHIKDVFYTNKKIGPYGVINAEIVNTGLAPGLEATVKAFRCAVLTEESAYTDSSDALDFAVEWDKDELAVAVGETLTGHVTYLPEDANSGTTLTLTVTGDTDAATAVFEEDLITVTGVQDGEVTIEAALPSGMKKNFVVKVGTGVAPEEPNITEVQSVTLDKSTLTLTEGDTTTLTASVLPTDATDKNVMWSVTPAGIATLSATTGESVTLTAKAAGDCTVTATAGEKTATCAVIVAVDANRVQSITMVKSFTMGKDTEDMLDATVVPDTATDKTVTWSVEPDGILSISSTTDGTTGSRVHFTALATGTATVTATAGGKSASCTITVQEEPLTIETIAPIDSLETTWKRGDQNRLAVWITPPNVVKDTVTWSVEPEGIITLDMDTMLIRRAQINGEYIGVAQIRATATKAGTCTVTATANGMQVTYKVTVEKETEDVEGETPVYELSAEKTFVPANKEYIDTGIKMFESIDPKPSWTILFEADRSATAEAKGDTYVLMHCMEESTPWPGFVVHMVGNGMLQTNIYGGKSGMKLYDALANRCRMAIRISGTTATRWQNAYTKGDFTISSYNTAVAKSLLLGCYQASDGTKGRFWDGTLYQCLVYEKALTDEQVETWLKG